MNISIVQSNGLLALEIKDVLEKAGHIITNISIDELNISDELLTIEYFNNKQLDLILFAEGFENVEEAEGNKEEAFAINSSGALVLAKICKQKSIPLLYIGTDLIFDGAQDTSYLPDSETNPLNIYGKSKLLGEKHITNTLDKYYIIRTGKLFGNKHSNFVDEIIKRAKAKEDFNAADDYIFTPTWTFTVAKTIEKLIDTTKLKINYGTYHCTNSGHCSEFKLIADILHNLSLYNRVYPIKLEETNLSVRVPKYRVLNCSNTPGIRIHWMDALNEYLKDYEL